MKLRIAGLQMPVDDHDVAANARRICAGIRAAAAERADVLLTPEGSLSGYRPDFDVTAVAAALAQVTAEAQRCGIGLALGTCFREDDGRCYNELRFYRADGEHLGFHTKILRCAHLPVAKPGDELNHYATRELRTFEWAPGIVVGGLICNDMWANPECTPMPDVHLVQQLAARGARVIFHAVNGGRDGSEWARVNWQYHEANLRMRARAGGVWIATVDNAFPAHLDCSAPCGVVAPDGSWACRTEARGERMFVHTVQFGACVGARTA